MEQIARVEKGDPDEAAQALIKAIPNGETLASYYLDVLTTAKSASGKMNLDPLKNTSEFYDGPPAELRADGDRGTAILWWAALKLWELPKRDAKQPLVDKFVTDIDMLVEGKRISPVTGMDLAWSAVFRPGVDPEASTDSLARLLRKYADSPSTDVSKEAMERIRNILTYLSPDTEVETYRFFKAHKPGEDWPESVRDLYRWTVSPGVGNISREEYDKLSTLTLRQYYEELKEESRSCAGGRRCPHFFCPYAIGHFVESYPRYQGEVTEILKSLLNDGLYTEMIGWCVLVRKGEQSADPREISHYRPLINEILAIYEHDVLLPNDKTFGETNSALRSGLDSLHGEGSTEDVEVVKKFQEKYATILLRAVGNWAYLSSSRRGSWFGPSPIDTLTDAWPRFYPETKDKLRELAEAYLQTNSDFGRLNPTCREDLKKGLVKLLALK